MKIEVRNLGPIEEAKVTLKPFTIFVGENNAGKSWLAYALASIFGFNGRGKYREAYLNDEVAENYKIIERSLNQLIEKGTVEVDLLEVAEEIGEEYLNNVASLSNSWMSGFLGTEHNKFDDMEIRIKLGEEKELFREQIKGVKVDNAIQSKEGKEQVIRAAKESGQQQLFFYSSGEQNALKSLPRKEYERFIFSQLFGIIHNALYHNTYIFPPERSTLLQFSPASSSLPEDEQLKEVEEEALKRIPDTLGSFLAILQKSYNKSLAEREKAAEDDETIQRYLNLAEFLESGILGGEVDITETAPNFKDILFRHGGEIDIEIAASSSMVKELSPLLLYLRFIAKPGDWIVFDEPEMNLHPKAQVKLAEFLSVLANSGIRILATTHSSYFVDHMVNLMRAADVDREDQIEDKFFLGNSEAFVHQHRVSAYLFKESSATNILTDEGLIDWDTFSSVSEKIEELYFEM